MHLTKCVTFSKFMGEKYILTKKKTPGTKSTISVLMKKIYFSINKNINDILSRKKTKTDIYLLILYTLFFMPTVSFRVGVTIFPSHEHRAMSRHHKNERCKVLFGYVRSLCREFSTFLLPYTLDNMFVIDKSGPGRTLTG